jgi:hypothetical protein
MPPPAYNTYEGSITTHEANGMIKHLRNVFISALGLTIVSAPLAAGAAPTGYVRTSGYHAAYGGYGHTGPGYGGYRPGYGYYRPGYAYRPGYGYYRPAYGYYRPGYRYYRPGYPYGFAYVNGWYGFTPLGWYGYYWNGGWYQHRRWSGGVWLYF